MPSPTFLNGITERPTVLQYLYHLTHMFEGIGFLDMLSFTHVEAIGIARLDIVFFQKQIQGFLFALP
jgi:hypothetical protein